MHGEMVKQAPDPRMGWRGGDQGSAIRPELHPRDALSEITCARYLQVDIALPDARADRRSRSSIALKSTMMLHRNGILLE